MALDVGNVRIGVAASDPTQTISTPLNSLPRKNSISEIKEICSDRAIVLILVGMPYLPSGKLGTQARITEAFINELKISIEIPIQTADERMTTIEAKIRLKESGYKNISKAGNKGIIDSAAAAVLLDEYISSL
ncbi:MAG: Holliday junction resolvase RuvX [SAR202 cluster bacterium]|uniref:YqgF/RNase H-like domain-containing protein n=1 Tax=marine metagenome TaxID=408172 RepID=A0A382BIH8_9ZZZZ|nr:Holliday junction resolvase RuvX [SAR202 cluster bacterium]HJO60720.1 Holliday junction resolvase RuvX [SAR202 cluster bacterium]